MSEAARVRESIDLAEFERRLRGAHVEEPQTAHGFEPMAQAIQNAPRSAPTVASRPSYPRTAEAGDARVAANPVADLRGALEEAAAKPDPFHSVVDNFPNAAERFGAPAAPGQEPGWRPEAFEPIGEKSGASTRKRMLLARRGGCGSRGRRRRDAEHARRIDGGQRAHDPRLERTLQDSARSQARRREAERDRFDPRPQRQRAPRRKPRGDARGAACRCARGWPSGGRSSGPERRRAAVRPSHRRARSQRLLPRAAPCAHGFRASGRHDHQRRAARRACGRSARRRARSVPPRRASRAAGRSRRASDRCAAGRARRGSDAAQDARARQPHHDGLDRRGYRNARRPGGSRSLAPVGGGRRDAPQRRRRLRGSACRARLRERSQGRDLADPAALRLGARRPASPRCARRRSERRTCTASASSACPRAMRTASARS